MRLRRYYVRFRCQAQSWNKQRRVVGKVEQHPDELYPRGFIVTNLRGLPSASSPSRTSAARRSSGSRRARARLNGSGCHVGPSPRMLSAFSSTSWPTTSTTSCARWRCRSRRSRGRRRACARSSSRSPRPKPRALHDLPDGQRRGIAATVRRDSGAHRRASGTTRAGITSAGVKCGKRRGEGMPR